MNLLNSNIMINLSKGKQRRVVTGISWHMDHTSKNSRPCTMARYVVKNEKGSLLRGREKKLLPPTGM